MNTAAAGKDKIAFPVRAQKTHNIVIDATVGGRLRRLNLRGYGGSYKKVIICRVIATGAHNASRDVDCGGKTIVLRYQLWPECGRANA
jgi:hypothetical protein